jgi:hypothetical protein
VEIMSDKTGPLTPAEFETLTNLLRRFEANHCEPTPSALARVCLVRASVHSAARAERDAVNDPLVQLLATPAASPVEHEHVDGLAVTAGPQPVPVHEMLNEPTRGELIREILSGLPDRW